MISNQIAQDYVTLWRIALSSDLEKGPFSECRFRGNLYTRSEMVRSLSAYGIKAHGMLSDIIKSEPGWENALFAFTTLKTVCSLYGDEFLWKELDEEGFSLHKIELKKRSNVIVDGEQAIFKAHAYESKHSYSNPWLAQREELKQQSPQPVGEGLDILLKEGL